jgi:hypothetical protein
MLPAWSDVSAPKKKGASEAQLARIGAGKRGPYNDNARAAAKRKKPSPMTASATGS